MAEFKIGQKVVNFKAVGTVIGFHEITGDLILEDVDGLRWLADKKHCKPAQKTEEKSGYILID